MTSPPAQHDPADNGPGREDADAHPPLGRVEAGPQRHSDPFHHGMAREIVSDYLAKAYGESVHHLHPQDSRLLLAIAAALRSVDRAAREECARIADGFRTHKILGVTPGPEATFDNIGQHFFRFSAERVAETIRKSIKD